MTTSNSISIKQRGLSLVELMIAMAIGLVLIGGALFVYSNARAAYTTNENYALMQENARFALSVIEPDVQLAGFWGQHREASEIGGSAQERAASGTVLGGITNDCANNWVIQFDRHIEGFNDIEADWSDWACVPTGAENIQPGSDVFAIRRVEATPAAALTGGQVYLRSSEKPRSEVFVGNNEPTTLPDTAQNFAVVANGYYIRPADDANPDNETRPPALRRVQLMSSGGTAEMVNTEITTGIEDMQIQYGIGPADVAGTRGGVSIYVNDIENLTPPNNTVRSMRIWLLMRSERQEFDYIDDQDYQLGDKIIPARNDNFRRLVVSKTIFFRNQH